MKKTLITLIALLCTLALSVALSVTVLATGASEAQQSEGAASEETTPRADNVVQGSCGDDVLWFLNRTTGELSIIGTGAMTYDKNHVPWNSYRNDIRTVYISDGITNIPDSSFYMCPHIYKVTLGKDIKSMGTHSFGWCIGLVEIYNRSSMVIYAGNGDVSTGLIGENVKNIYTPTSGSTKIETVGDFVFYRDPVKHVDLLLCYTGSDSHVVLPEEPFDSAYDIHYGAFYNMRFIEQVTIPNRVNKIHQYAFYRCTGLTELYLPDSVSWIQTGAIIDCTSLTHVRVGSGLLIMEENSFYNCDSLVEICNDSDFVLTAGEKIESQLTNNARHVYTSQSGSSRLSEQDGFIVYTDGDEKKTLVKYVGDEKDVVIPDGIYEIAVNAFLNLDIEGVVIPSSVELMESNAFYGCDSLTNVTLPYVGRTRNDAYGSYKFTNIFGECPNVKKVTLTEGDTIPSHAFAFMTELEEVVFPEGLTKIEPYAFLGCSSIKEMVIPDTVTDIGAKILDECDSLETLTIPYLGAKQYNDGVITHLFDDIPMTLRHVTLTKEDKLAYQAFYGCAGLISITLPETLGEIGKDAFMNCLSLSEIYNLSELDVVAGSDTHGGVALHAYVVHTSLDEPSSIVYFDGFSFIKNEVSGKYTLIKYTGKEKSVVVPDTVGDDKYAIDRVASYAFTYNYDVEEVYLPFGVVVIESSAFYNTSVIKLEVPSTITTVHKNSIPNTSGFEYNYLDGIGYIGNPSFPYLIAVTADLEKAASITSYVAPEQTKIILKDAFSQCKNLTSVTLTDNLVYVEHGIFGVWDGPKIQEATVPAWATMHIATNSIRKVTVFSGEALKNSAFANCTALQTVILHDRLEVIGDSAFYNCTSLGSITLPDNVCKIGASAFEKCKNLKEIKLPYYLREIPLNCFKDCTSLETVDFNSDDICIVLSDKGAFENCTALKKVIVESDIAWLYIEFIDQYSNPTYYSKSLYINDTLLTDLVVSSGIPKIGAHQFVNNTALKSIHLYEGTEIESGAFAGCTGIESATMPADKFNFIDKAKLKTAIITQGTELPNSIFSGCTSLESVTLPMELKTIGNHAFYGCTALKSLHMTPEISFIGKSAFSETSIERVDAHDIESWCSIVFENHLSNPASGGMLYVGGAPLEVLDIPETVTSISDYAFYNLTSVRVISIKRAGVEMGEYSLYGIKPSCLIIHADYIPAFAEYKSELTAVEIVDGDTIPDYAFFNCDKLSSVILPDKLKTIGKNAFEGCMALESISIPESVTLIDEWAFASCIALKSIAIPEGVTQINDYTFSNCSALTEIAWHNKLTDIGDFAFTSCTSLRGFAFVDGLKTIGNSAFSSCTSLGALTIPENVESIGSYAFAYCGNVTYLNIENPSVKISDYAFTATNGIETAYIPASAIGYVPLQNATNVTVTSGDKLPDNAFYNCTKLVSVSLPKELTYIGEKAFYDCSAMTSIYIPSGVTSIGANAFYGCSSLDLVQCDSIASWLNVQFGDFKANPLSGGATLATGDSSSDIVIPEGTVKINAYAFAGMGNTAAISIPSSVKEIGDNAFRGAYSLQIVKITDMAAWCGISFADAESNPLLYAGRLYLGDEQVTEVVIPNSITKLLPYVFAGSTTIESIVIPRETTSFDPDILYSCNSVKNVLYCGESLDALIFSVPLGAVKVEHHRYSYVAQEDGHYMLCSVCQSTTDVMPHAFDTITDDYLLATHTSEGYNTYECACGQTLRVVTPVIQHEFYMLIERFEPTHMTEGYERYACSCGATMDYPVDKLPIHEWDNGTITTEPTHTEYGVITYTCPCGESYTEEADKLPIHEWGEGTITLAPTHTQLGVIAYTCACGSTREDIINALPEHTFGEWEQLDASGHKRYCECGESQKEIHCFTDSLDATCNDCGFIREIDAPSDTGNGGNDTNATEQKPSDPIEPETKPGEGEDGQSSGGCGGTMNGGAIFALVLSLAAALPLSKRKKR